LTGAIVATQVNPAHPNPHDFVNGFQLGLRVAAGIAFTGVLIAAFGIKPEQLRHDVAEPKQPPKPPELPLAERAPHAREGEIQISP
jgi:hypothetical protein